MTQHESTPILSHQEQDYTVEYPPCDCCDLLGVSRYSATNIVSSCFCLLPLAIVVLVVSQLAAIIVLLVATPPALAQYGAALIVVLAVGIVLVLLQGVVCLCLARVIAEAFIAWHTKNVNENLKNH